MNSLTPTTKRRHPGLNVDNKTDEKHCRMNSFIADSMSVQIFANYILSLNTFTMNVFRPALGTLWQQGSKFANMSHHHLALSMSIKPQLTAMDILRRPKPWYQLQKCRFKLVNCKHVVHGTVHRNLSWESVAIRIGPGDNGGTKDPPRFLAQHWQILQLFSSLENPHQSPSTLLTEAQLSCHALSSKCLGRILFRHYHLLQSSKYPPQSPLALLADARSSCHATWDQLQPQHRPTVI